MIRPRRSAGRPARVHAAAAWLLVLALLLAQGLGLWHGVAHAQPHVAQADDGGHADDAFGHGTDDPASCRLYDAVGQGAAPAGEPPALPTLVPAAPEALPPAVAAPGRAAPAYRARAPPA